MAEAQKTRKRTTPKTSKRTTSKTSNKLPTLKQFMELCRKHGSCDKVAKNTDLTRQTCRELFKKAKEKGLKIPAPSEVDGKKVEPVVLGSIKATKAVPLPLPEKGKIKRYIVTAAQTNTFLHHPFVDNLEAYAKFVDAQIYVSLLTYVKPGRNSGREKNHSKAEQEDWYDPRIQDYLLNRKVKLAPGLEFCAEMNTRPSAVNPLSGLESYTQRKSGIFPHTQIAMRSIPSGRHEPTKFNYTTGAITQLNYIQQKTGLKAEFHHCYGALIVEVDHTGLWFVRQLNAEDDGSFYDLTTHVKNGKITEGHRVEAITWGDLHVSRIDPDVVKMAWTNKDSMTRVLNPKHHLVHDVLDFESQNHHHRRQPFRKYQKHVEKRESVREELDITFGFLYDMAKEFPEGKFTVADSNHDRALERWLEETSWKEDMLNAELHLEATLAKVKALKKNEDFHMMRHLWEETMKRWKKKDPGVRFLALDEPFYVCRNKDGSGGIRCDMHGDLGPNGSRGSALNLSKMGIKLNIGHSHTAGIYFGVYQAGTCSLLFMLYNVGPGSWSHTQIVVLPNGKRQMITMFKNQWRHPLTKKRRKI